MADIHEKLTPVPSGHLATDVQRRLQLTGIRLRYDGELIWVEGRDKDGRLFSISESPAIHAVRAEGRDV